MDGLLASQWLGVVIWLVVLAVVAALGVIGYLWIGRESEED